MWREFLKFFIPAGSAWFLLIPNKCDGGFNIENIEIDSGGNRDAFEVHSGTFWQDLKWLAVSILPQMEYHKNI